MSKEDNIISKYIKIGEMVDRIAQKTGQTKTLSREFLDAVVDTMKEALLEDKSIHFANFVNISTSIVPERRGVVPNGFPHAGDEWVNPEHKTVRIKAAGNFMDELNA